MPASRPNRRRFIPVLDQLEHRNLLAGNITSVIRGHELELFGDDEANQISIVSNGNGTVTVTALDGTTTINNTAGPVTFTGITKGIGVAMRGGDDVLEVTGVHLKRGLNIDMGDGDDTLTISGVVAGKRSGMTAGDGNDTATITASAFTDLQYQGSTGDDSLTINGVKAGRRSALDGGGDDNTLTQSGNSFKRGTTIKNWGTTSNGTLPVAVDDSASVNKGGTISINVASNDTTPTGTLDLTSLVVTTQPTHGTITVNNDGTISYTHNGDTFASDTFEYTIKNSNNKTSNPGTVTITINQGPTALNDTGSVDQLGNTTINVAANDTASNGTIDLTSIVIVTQPTHGAVVVNNDGTVKYTNDGSAGTSDSFTYTIKDSLGAVSNTATVAITVGAGPTAVADTGSVAKGGNTIVNVAANDTTPTGTIDLTSIVIVTQPTHGTVVVNNDGTVKYTNNGDTATTDTFTYKIKNSLGGFSNNATVTMTITQGPVAADDTATVPQVGSVTIPVSDNDSPTNGTLDLTTIVIGTQPAHGSLTVNNDGSVTYHHDGSASTSDSFTYTIKNSLAVVSNVATVSITIGAGPAAVNDAATVLKNGNVDIDLAANDSTPNGTLDLTSIVITTQPTHGTLQINNDGTVTYTHTGGIQTTDTFSYTIKNSLGGVSNVATVSLTIDQGIVANDDTADVSQQGGNVIIPVSTNDTAGNGTLDLASIVITTQPTHGTVQVNDDGTVTYTHNNSATTSDSFAYTIKDSFGAVSSPALVSITIAAGTAADDDIATLLKNGSVVVNVASNDSTPNGTLDLTTVEIITQPTHGTLVVHDDGTVTYTHTGGIEPGDFFTYTIKNSLGGVSNIATVTLTIDQGIVANDDTADVSQQGGNVIIPVSTNDTAANGTLDLASIVITTQPAHGTVQVNDDGTVTYTHNNSATTSDTFAYTIKDSFGAVSSPATVSVTIAAGTVAGPDAATVIKDGNVNIDLIANDSTPNGTLDLTSIIITAQPTHGTLQINNDGTVTYTHTGGTETSDSFSYTIKNSLGGVSNAALVSLLIDQGPAAGPDAADVAKGGTVNIPVSTNDTVTNGTLDLASIVITTAPSHGTATPNADGTLTYTHDNSDTTSDSFAYTIKDSLGAISNPATVTLAIA